MTTTLPDTPHSGPATEPLALKLTEGLGPNATEFDKYAFLADFDITRSTCGGRAGRYASEVTQRAYMVWADRRREIERLREAEASFHMEYRLKCDVENKAQAQEIERLRAALRTAISTLERDGDEWNICEHLRAALGPNAK